MKKPYAIYKQPRLKGTTKWTLHRKYDSMSKANQAWTDLIKTPRKLRYYAYVVYPVLDHAAREVVIKPEYNEEFRRMAR